MALLSEVALVPFPSFRLGIPVDTEVLEPQTGATLTGASVLRRSALDCSEARNVTLAPVRARTVRAIPFTENVVATYLDQDYEIRGTVLDSADNPIERRVLVLTRAGTLLGITRSAVDGTFSVRTTGYLLNRTINVAVPDDGDLRNAVVKWGVIPVAPL